MKNTMYRVKMLDRINLGNSQKCYFIVYDENKIAFCFKKGCFIGSQNQCLRLKKRCLFFFVQKSWKGDVFRAWVWAWYNITVTAHWPVGIASPVGGHTSARLKCGCECSVNLTPLDHPGVRQSAWQLGSSQPDHITARQRKQGNQPDNSEAVSLTTSQGIHWCQAPCSDGCSAVQ